MSELLSRSDHVASGHADDFIRKIKHDESTYVGAADEWEGAFTSADITSSDIAEWVSSEGDPWLSERRNFEPGAYLIRLNSDGIVWGFHYPTAADRDADFAELERAYAEWADDDTDPDA